LPADYVPHITHPFFSLSPGKIWVYKTKSDDAYRTELTVTGETYRVMNTETLVYRERLYHRNELIRDIRNYLTQDIHGTVWCFGRIIDSYESGAVIHDSGSWVAGVNGVKPGVWIKAVPRAGERYRRGSAAGKTDLVSVESDSETLVIQNHVYEDCLKLKEYSRENTVAVYRYYCPEISNVVAIEQGKSGERMEWQSDESVPVQNTSSGT